MNPGEPDPEQTPLTTLPPAPAPDSVRSREEYTEAAAPLVMATRTARLAAGLIDGAIYLALPLVPTLVLFFLRRPDAPVEADEYIRLVEGTALPIAHRLLGTGWSATVSLLAPVLAFALLQWVFVARLGQSLGQQIVGVRSTRQTGAGETIGLLGAAARPLLIVGVAAAIGRFVPLTGYLLPWPLRSVLVLLVLLLVDMVPAAGSARLTIRDRVFGTRTVALFTERVRAFEAPRFSAVGFLITVGGFVASILVAGALFAIVSRFSDLESTDIDVPSVVGGAALPLGLVLTGVLAAYKARRFIVGELALVMLLLALLAYEAMIWGVLPVPALQKFMVPGIVDWSVYSFGGYFGAVIFVIIGSALGFMIASDSGPDFSTRFERLVARRHLRLKFQHWLQLAVIATLAPIVVYGVFIWPVRAVRRLMKGQAIAKPLPPTVFMALLTIVGVMFGVTSLTVVLGVMGGFERDLKDKILGTTAHGIVQNFNGNFSDWRESIKKITAVPGVAGATPFVYAEVMISTDTSVTGAILHGIDPDTISQVTDLNRSIANKGDGRLTDLTYPDRIPTRSVHRDDSLGMPDPDDAKKHAEETVLPGIIVGREMAHSLNVWVGDRVSVMNPMGELGPNGPIPRSRTFRVAAVFVTGMFEYDSKFAYVQLAEAQKFFRLNDSVTGIELRFNNVDEARPLMKKIIGVLGDFPYRGKDWGQMNSNLFSALRLERVVMFVLLSFQVLIACICVIATLVMLVIEKRKEVATLKAMGAREGSIMRLFVLEGLIIGGIGTFYGSAAGYLFCKLIEKFGVGLNPEIYYIEKLPVVIEPVAFISVAAVAMVLVFVATIYPARRGGSIAPVEGFREE